MPLHVSSCTKSFIVFLWLFFKSLFTKCKNRKKIRHFKAHPHIISRHPAPEGAECHQISVKLTDISSDYPISKPKLGSGVVPPPPRLRSSLFAESPRECLFTLFSSRKVRESAKTHFFVRGKSARVPKLLFSFAEAPRECRNSFLSSRELRESKKAQFLACGSPASTWAVVIAFFREFQKLSTKNSNFSELCATMCGKKYLPSRCE